MKVGGDDGKVMTEVSEILTQHWRECESVRKLIDDAMLLCEPEKMEFAKLFAESVAILHETERKAHGINADSINLVRIAMEEKTRRSTG